MAHTVIPTEFDAFCRPAHTRPATDWEGPILVNQGPLPFGQWLKQRRKSLDLTQEDIALRVDCSVSSIEKIESGERRPSRQVADLLAGCLGIPADERQAFIRFARSEPRRDEAPQELPERAPWRAVHRRRNNLPVPLTPLVGRAPQVAALHTLLMRERARLITLTGPPGIGKTRLALEVAAEVSHEFEDGVFFVPLSPITDPGLVLPAIAHALHVSEVAGRSQADSLKEHLGDKRALLVLDNFEHVMQASVGVVDILTFSPWLKVLVTSREPLRVRGERRFPVPPLDVPDPEHLPDTSALLDCSSVALFVERARETDPDLELTDDGIRASAQLCAYLEGVPLAIELVAARPDALSMSALLQGPEGSLEVHSDLQDVPPRHRTLRDATHWSYDLLDAGEQALFARLSVFAGGCTRSAAEAVCNSKGDLPLKVSRGLASLAGKSLLNNVAVDEGEGQGALRDEPRYTMLQTIHEYALERLQERGEVDSIRHLHAEHYLALAEAADSELEGPRQAELMDWLENEHANLQAALGWTLAGGSPEMALQLSGALAQFWSARGYLSEGRRWLEKALAVGGDAETPHRARALVGAGLLAARQGDYAHAKVLYEAGLGIYRECGHKRGTAMALSRLGAAANEQGDLGRADLYYQESLDIYRALGNTAGVAGILNNLGNQEIVRGNVDQAAAFYEESLRMSHELGDKLKVATALLNLGRLALYHRSDHRTATAYLEESLALRRETGSKGGIAAALYQMGQVMLYRGSYAQAQSFFEESLQLCEQLNEKPGIASTRLGLGLAVLLQGGYKQARSFMVESLALYRQQSMGPGVIGCLEGMAGLAVAEGDPERAARLLGAVEALREDVGMSAPGIHASLLVRWEEETRARLDTGRFEAARDAGRTMKADEAIACALAQC